MSGSFTTEFRGEYIQVTHPEGCEINPRAMRAAWRAIGEVCRRHGCNKVLVEARLVVRRSMSETSAYRSAEHAMEAARGVRIAFLFPGYPRDGLTDFFKLAAANRGVHVEFFDDRTEALRWLRVTPDESAPGAS